MALTQLKTGAIADDAVTTDKLANAINTERTANTAKSTNATHTGEVTGSGALTITDDTVDEANLKVSNSPTNGYFLSAQSGDTGGLTWAAVTGTTINNNADNRIITGSGTANTLEGEANLTYNGTRLNVGTGDLAVTGAEGGDAQLRLTADEGDDGADYWRLESNASTNKFNLATYASGSWVNKFAMDTNGRIGILDPNLDNFDSDADDLVINGSGNTGITINSGAATSTSEGNLVFAEGNGTGGSADGFRGAIQYKHGDDYMRFYTDNAERLRITSSGNVGINKTDPSDKFHVEGTTNFTGNSYIGGDLYMYGSSYTKGIFLGGSGSANKLDDYEEGTWTPHVDGWDTYSPYSGASYNYNWYVKIGQLVHVGWKLYIQNLTTVSSDAHIRITGLPFAHQTSAAGAIGHIRFDIPEYGMSGYPIVYLGGGGTILYMYKHVNGSSSLAAMNAAANRSNVWCMGTATYATS